MSEREQSRGSLVVREAALTILYLLAYPLILAGWVRYGYTEPPARIVEELTPANLLWNKGFGDLYVSLLTFDFGPSIWFQRPVREVIAAALGETLALVATSLVVFGLLAGAGLAMLRSEGNGALRSTVLGVATLASSVPAVFWLVLAFVFAPSLSTGSAVGLLVGGALLSLPLVGFFTRRFDLQKQGATGSRPSTLRDRFADRTWSVDGWFYLSYYLGALVVVEHMTRMHGLGEYLYYGLSVRDVPLMIGMTLVIVQVAVVLGFGRNLAWVLLERSDESEVGGASDDGGQRARGTRRPTASALRSPRVLVGAVGLFVLIVVGAVGSLVFSPSIPPARGATPWMITAGLAAILWDLATAWVAALVVGVPFGIVGARVGPLGTAFRAFFDLIMNVPLLVFVLVGVLVGFPFGLFAISVGMIPYVFRLTLARYAGSRDEAWSANEVMRDLGGVLARTGSYFVVVLFLVMELLILGAVPWSGPLADIAGLYQIGRIGDTLLGWAIVVGAPALAIHLLTDGFQSSLGTNASGVDG